MLGVSRGLSFFLFLKVGSEVNQPFRHHSRVVKMRVSEDLWEISKLYLCVDGKVCTGEVQVNCGDMCIVL